MASRRSEAGVSRPRRKPSNKGGGTTQFVMIAVAVVVVIVVAVLLFGGGGKKSGPLRTSTASATDQGTYAKPARAPAHASVLQARRDTARARKLQERAQSAGRTGSGQGAIAGGARTTRSATGGYTRSAGTHIVSSPNELRAILADSSGARTALVGDRRLKAGDDVAGHRIVEVGGDDVKVQFGDNTYTVKVGDNLY